MQPPEVRKTVDEVRFYHWDDQSDSPGNNEPGGEVWVNAADLIRAVRAHEDAIFAVAAAKLGGGFAPLLREAIKAANQTTIDLINRLIVHATKTANRNSN